MKGKMTVSHAKFQYYRHNYCLVCMTGLLGCRWHRYQQSTRDNRKRDVFWFSLFTLTFLYITFFFYFWLISQDGYTDLDWYMFDMLKVWVPWYRILLPVTCTVFGYFLLVMILYLCHIGHGHQIFIHAAHIVFILLSLAACVVFTVLIDELWNSQYYAVYISLQMFGPFLHVGAVAIMTALMWLISHSWYKLTNRCWQLVWLMAIVGGMVLLYIAPLYIHCPCVTSSPLPPKPALFAHRGAEAIAPENTVISFERAVKYGAFGLESDVRISLDGVPFLHHDDTFLRTTNVKEVFPDRADQDVSLFNISDIRKLNAGVWFLQHDPFHTAGGVSDQDRQVYTNQSVPLLRDLLDISTAADTMVMFDVRGPGRGHPFHGKEVQQVVEVLNRTAFDMPKLYWLVKDDGEEPTPPTGATLVYAGAPPEERLAELNISTVNVKYSGVHPDRIQSYRAENISSNIFVVDSAWSFSYFWCLGASSITTRRVDQLSTLQQPVWTLMETSYLILWVAVDVLSAVIIIVLFIVQRIRLFGTSFSPESVSLTAARRGARSYRSRTMKEKLLREGGGMESTDDTEGPGAGVLNHPAAYSMSSLPPSTSFSSPIPTSSPTPITTVHPSITTTITQQPDHKYEVE